MIRDHDGNQRFYGLYRGTVADIHDPLKKRRIRMHIPQVLGTAMSEWAWAKESASTKVHRPNVGQGVWVMFEGGDIAFPIWVGTFGDTDHSEQHMLLKPVPKGADSGLETYIKKNTASDGTTEVDLGATVVALATQLKALKTAHDSLQSAFNAYVATHP